MIDFKKYKRFFAFGCSMTSYSWPTWADIIAQEIPESYNFGRTGAGNIFISNQIAEAHSKYKFINTDLIIVMWSTVVREDRYVNRQWHCQGNIHNQTYYDKNFVMKYVDTRGQLIRDLGLITLTKGFLDSLCIDYHMLTMQAMDSISLGDYAYDESDYSDVFNVYKSTIDSLKPDMLNTGCNGNWYSLPIRHSNGNIGDYHPSPIVHLQYLNQIFMNTEFSLTTKKFVQDHDAIVKATSHFDDLIWKSNTPTML